MQIIFIPGTDDMTLKLIRLRTEYKELFTRKKGSATLGYK